VKILLIACIIASGTLFADSAISGFDVMQFAPILLIFVIFYFLIMRPQQKKAQAHQAMIKELRRGDRVVTAGGILGIIDKVINETEVSLEIAQDVKVRVLKSTIGSLVAKTQPISESAKTDKSEAKSEDTKDKKKNIIKAKSAVKTPAKKTNK